MGRRARSRRDSENTAARLRVLRHLADTGGTETTTQIAEAISYSSLPRLTHILETLTADGHIYGDSRDGQWQWTITGSGRRAHDRPDTAADAGLAPLPDMVRLLSLWDGLFDPSTQLGHATRVCVGLWMELLEHVVIRSADDLAVYHLEGDALDLYTTVVRALDDEVTWHLGNDPDAVVLIDDDDPDPATVGELIAQIACYSVLLDKWPQSLPDCPLSAPFRQTGALYEALVTDLVNGSARQPRRRSHGMPPIQPPRRIDLGRLPPDLVPDSPATIIDNPHR
ncbi:hypothetical protein F5X71_34510 [Nocardia brasiliensis]|uniref:Uncharacterized protein n=1 Tax=Nocardia brasiliensis TaxID=37326 RepID=A0A6G9Y0U9_NOCBR|nr:hypothetical protein [Nocardia brasiliensis]QIS06740.1 hypothetical protein F5X71_34510 [Nocardia brasiliensis]